MAIQFYRRSPAAASQSILSFRGLFICCLPGRSAGGISHSNSLATPPMDRLSRSTSDCCEEDVESGAAAPLAVGFESILEEDGEEGEVSALDQDDMGALNGSQFKDTELLEDVESIKATTIYGENGPQSVISVDEHVQHQVPSCGRIIAKMIYDPRKLQLKFTSKEAVNLPTPERGGSEAFQLCLVIIPAKKARYRSGIVPYTNPDFNINYGLKPFPVDEIADSALRIRLYGCERNRRKFLLGECVIGLAGLELKKENTYSFRLEARRGLKKGLKSASAMAHSSFDSDSDEPLSSGVSLLSTQPQGNQPELFLGLAYNVTTGRLAVEVVKGSCFSTPKDPMQMTGFGQVTKVPDSYVRLAVTSKTGQDLIHTKTVVRRKDANPQFRQKFMFHVAQFQLPDVTLMVTVLHRKSMTKKVAIGWFALGGTNSGEDEDDHWQCMLSSKGEQVRRWHALQQNSQTVVDHHHPH